jgi:hypothetical protein
MRRAPLRGHSGTLAQTSLFRRAHTERVTRGVLLGIAIAATVVAAVPIVAYPLRPGGRLDPYRNRDARWAVYLGAGVALALFIVLAPNG